MKRVVLTAAFAMALVAGAPSVPSRPAHPTRAQAQQKAPNVAEFDKAGDPDPGKHQKLQEQMDKIRQTQDPQERQNCSRSMRRPCKTTWD